MFFELLGIAFIVEMFLGIGIGWLFATFFARRTESFENTWSEVIGHSSALRPLSPEALAGHNSDSPIYQQKITRLEQALAQMESKMQKLHTDLKLCRETLDHSTAHGASLKSECDTLNAKLVSEQTTRALLETQLAQSQKETLDAQTLVKALEASRTDLNHNLVRIQGELNSAEAAREKLMTQINIYKDKMRVVGATMDPVSDK